MEQNVDWLTFIVGIIAGLFGWTLYWFGVQVIGTFLGGSLGMGLAVLVSSIFELPDNAALMMICVSVALGGILGFMLMRTVQFFFFFLIGFSFGAPLAWRLVSDQAAAGEAWAGNGASQAIAVVAGGLIGGFIVVLGKRYVVALVTAVFGAALITASVHTKNPMAVAIPAFLISAAVQTGMIRAFIPKRRTDK